MVVCKSSFTSAKIRPPSRKEREESREKERKEKRERRRKKEEKKNKIKKREREERHELFLKFKLTIGKKTIPPLFSSST